MSAFDFSPTRGKSSRTVSIFVETRSTAAFLRQFVATLLAGTSLFMGMPAKGESPTPSAATNVRAYELAARGIPRTSEAGGIGAKGIRAKDVAARESGASHAGRISVKSVFARGNQLLSAEKAVPSFLPAAQTNSALPEMSARVEVSGIFSRPLDSMFKAPFLMQSGGPPNNNALSVYVGYADNLRAGPSFPVPWQGSPNTLFIGTGPSWDSGAIRLDNTSDTPINVSDVFVTVPGWSVSATRDAAGNGTADLWGSFTIAPHSTAILAQTSNSNNFDTSDFGVTFCGNTVPNGQAPIPTIKITINGTATTFSDTAHVLDTGGFDLACRGNESLQWRLIGTTGIENSTGNVSLSPATSIQPVGTSYTATALVTDASNQPNPNVTVDFKVLNGPNAGKTGTGTSDSQGLATFTYTSSLQGTDILQAFVTNASGGTIQSEQVTSTWTSADACPPPVQPPPPGATTLIYAGQPQGEFNDPLQLAAQLRDGNGVALSGRTLNFSFAGQTLQAQTDGNGIASVSLPAAPAPGTAPLTVSFAGDANFQASQLNISIPIGKEETAIRYTGTTLLGTTLPQAVSAVLVDPQSQVAIAGKTVTFRVGAVQAQAVTNAQGIAATTITLNSNQTSGPSAVQVAFAGDNLYKPAITGVPVTVYLMTSFVIWGGNQGGLHLGQDVNFWGAQWASQVTGGDFNANPSFKGFAQSLGGQQVQVCEPLAGSGQQNLDDSCWQSKPGNSFPPPLTLPAFIQVIISNAIAKQGSEIFGNIAATAVCQVDATPAYAPDPGHPGFCKLVAVINDGDNIFPTPPVLTVNQTQPATVLPAQAFNVTTVVANNSSTPANTVVVSENFDGVTPATGTQTFNSILNGAQQTATFQVTSPTIPIRQSNETSVDYQNRLSSLDGRLFTSTGSVSFTDAAGEPFLPIAVSSFSQLQLPELTLGISAPSCVGPGGKVPYQITISNIGSAEAKNVSLLVKFPDGTNTMIPFATIPAGNSVTTTVNFVVPTLAKQPNETDDQYLARLASIDGSSLVATARADWQDDLGNNYGEIEQQIFSVTERVPIWKLTPQLPASVLPSQKGTLNATVQNTGSGNSGPGALQVANPDGSTSNVSVPALLAGSATTVSTSFTAPAVAPRQAGETDAGYLARLSAHDNTPLNFALQLSWSAVSGLPMGPTTTPAQTLEVLPAVTVSLIAPATANSGDTIPYTVTLQNIGHATASSLSLSLTLPDGTVQTPTLPSSSLSPGATEQTTVSFVIPKSQPTGTITAQAKLNWSDANQNAYGPLSSAASTAVTQSIVGDIEVCYWCTKDFGFGKFQDGPIFVIQNTGSTAMTGGVLRIGPGGGTSDSFNVGTIPAGGMVAVAPGLSNDGAAGHSFFRFTGGILDTSDGAPSGNDTQFEFTAIEGPFQVDSGVFTPAATQGPSLDGTIPNINFLGGPGNNDGPCNAGCFDKIVANLSLSSTVKPNPAVLAIAKTHTGNFTQGQQNAIYTVTVSNGASAGPTSGIVTVTDTVPSGLTLVSMSGTGWTCAANSCSRSDVLATGGSYPAITVTVNVAANASSPQANTVTVSGGGSANASASDSTTITPAAALSITKSHTGNFTQGQQNATYILTVSNSASAGPTSGTVTVTDTAPSGLTMVLMAGAGWTCASNSCSRSDVLVSGGSYPPITVTVNVAANATSPQVNTATVSGGGSASASASDSTTITANPPALSIAKTHIGNFIQGQQNATYTVTVSDGASAGPTSGTVTATDTVPSGLTLVSMAGTGWTCATSSCTRSDVLAAGASYPPITVTVNVAANATSPQVNNGAVSGGGSASASASDSTTIIPAAALSITKSHTGNFTQGQQNATYTLTVSNSASAGPTSGTVTVTDTVPSGLTLVSMAGTGWTCITSSCTRADVLAAGGSYPPITATVNVAVNAGSPQVNTASVSGGGSTSASASDSTTITAGVPVLTQVNPNSGQQGQQTLTVAITGLFTHFVQATTTANFGAGVTVASLTVNSATSAIAVLNIDPAATIGPRNVTLTTGAEVATDTNGFAVTAGTPVLTQVNPNSGQQGQQNLSVIISGQFTHFVQGTSVASFGAGITVASLTVNSATGATAVVNIDPAAATGTRDVAVTTGAESVTLTGGFTVAAGVPTLVLISPNSGLDGQQNLSVAITGAFTHFVQGTSVANFGAGITVVSLTVNSPTTATAVLNIDPAAPAGARDVTVTTGAEVATVHNGFTVIPGPPQVSITAPTEGAEITNSTQVIGSVTSGSWTLQYALASADGAGPTPVFIPFASGTNAVNNGVLGTLDPTVLLNGNYIIQLTSTDQFGQSSSVSVNVDIARNAKPGIFTLSFNDLVVPVAGLPITVTRTYDSRDKGTHDFGVGWTLAISNVRLQKNGKLGANWQMTQSGGLIPNFCLVPTKPHIVTIIFPDNKVFKFQESTSPQCQGAAPIEAANLTFVQIPGTAGTQGASLQIAGDNSVLVNPPTPGPVELLDASANVANATVFQLTTAEGYAYIIDQSLGVTTLTDPNGNQLTINANGVTSSGGKNVAFTRDGLGRITQITDPAGKSLAYTYSAAGDLASFTDRAGNTTTFSYDPTHLLTNILDPRGVQGVKNTYDASGRLISTTDANGNTTTFTNDVAANHETITDRLGNATLYEYDDDGNVTRSTDPLGNVTTFTYDANDNRLTQTNGLGKTTTYAFDALGDQTSVTDPLGHTTTTTYNSLKQPLVVTDPLGHVTTNTYDSKGNLLNTKDTLGNLSTYSYNGQGQPQVVTDTLGNKINFAYDANGNLTQQTDALGNISTYTYDPNGNRLTQTVTRTVNGAPQTLTTTYEYDGDNRVIKTINPDGSTSQVIYNAIGKQSDTIDALGHTIHRDYDNNGRLVKTTYPDGSSESATYNANDRRISSTDRAGHVTSYTYDAAGRLTKTTFADGSSTQAIYDAIAQPIKTIDALGNMTQKSYDDAGHYVSVTDALGHVTKIVYDAAGNQISVTDALNHTTQFVYDNANRRIQTTYLDGTTDSSTYDALGRQIAKTDQAGKTTQYGYDALGRLVTVTDALGHITKYSYDEVGSRISQTDANGHTTTFAYDQLGRRIQRKLPMGSQVEAYSYDAVGNLTTRTDFNGHTTTFTYDSLNRMLSKTPDPAFSAPAVVFSYNVLGLRASMSDASGATTYSYDNRNRLLNKATPFGALSYTYDAAGNLLSVKSSNTNGVSNTYTYDALNRLGSVADTSGSTTYSYDNVGDLSAFAYPNGVQHSYAYNTLNRLTQVGASKNGTALSSYTYVLGAAGNRVSVAELSGRTVAYGYDDLYRLTSETIAGAAANNGAIGYAYDPVGNRTSMTSSVAAVPAGTFNYDANDRLGGDTYDSAGNTIFSAGIADAYDFENHLIQHGSVAVVYDGDGNRVSKTAGGVTTNYLVDTHNLTGYSQVFEELQSGNVARRYTYGLDLVSETQPVGGVSTTSFYLYDGHGSVRGLTDSIGNVTDTYDYDAFGNLIEKTGSTPNNFLFAGEQFDSDLGLYYNRLRYLDVRRGRFWTVDPDEGRDEVPASLHHYVYVANSPVNLVDPGGNSWINKLPQWLQVILVGTAVHGELYQDFYSKCGFPPFCWANTSVKIIFNVPVSTSEARILGLYDRPDLLDLTGPVGLLYEIKPATKYGEALGALDLVYYTGLLEEYDPQDRGIYPGDPAHYTPISNLTVYGDVNVEVDPPEEGLILYRVTNGGPSEWEPPTLNPVTALALYFLLFLLIAAALALVFEPAFAFI